MFSGIITATVAIGCVGLFVGLFLGLVLRVVKIVIQKATLLKEENDAVI